MKKIKLNLWIISLAGKLRGLFPNLQRELHQAQVNKTDIIFLSEAIKGAFINSVIFSSAIMIAAFLMKITLLRIIGIASFPLLFLFSFFLLIKRPAMLVRKRMKLLDKDLPYALRRMLISIRSGIPLYEAMVSVSSGYGEISKEFENIVKEIAVGYSEVEAIENSILRSPSIEYRRAMWQIISAIESGADISDTMESIVDAIVESQIQKVREYGRELSPYTMIYMILSVIFPSLGTTFLVILSTFTAIKFGDIIFYLVPFGLIVFQYFFIGFIRNKRPIIKM